MKGIFDFDIWEEIGNALSKNKTRTFLTGFGIFWGVFLLVILWAGSRGMNKIIEKKFDGIANNVAFLTPNKTTENYKGFSKNRQWFFNSQDVQILRDNIENIEIIDKLNLFFAKIQYKKIAKNIRIVSHNPETYKIQSPTLLSGRLVNEIDIKNKAKVVVLGKRLSEELFSNEDPIGKIVEINSIGYKVIGVIENPSSQKYLFMIDHGAHMPFSTMDNNFNFGDTIRYITFLFKDSVKISEKKDKIMSYIFKNHKISPTDTKALRIIDFSEFFTTMKVLLISLKILSFLVGIGSLIAGIIGIGNMMMVIIKERTPEIGIKRAIGAKPKDIVKQILLESLIITLFAGLLGLSSGVWMMFLMWKNKGGIFSISFAESLIILSIFVILGVVVAILPAKKALQIKPIEAMNNK